ncbi:MAG: hypothetical protein EZS28_008668 [Streblomastix strix]|uniref:Uncharacterized protein n=1 Tax=Streblomastix strix TaxID=222440 RepID=A0A5J4WMF3_9EUKA|nr:MAG: hypothetical protein EZS28_008668 [Streblomastix strix]
MAQWDWSPHSPVECLGDYYYSQTDLTFDGTGKSQITLSRYSGRIWLCVGERLYSRMWGELYMAFRLCALMISITAFSLLDEAFNVERMIDDDDGAQQYKNEKFELSCFETEFIFMLV